MGAGPGTGWVVEVGDDHGFRVGLDTPADIVGDEGERLGDGAATAIGANHGYLDRVVQRASLPATRARNGRGIGPAPWSTRLRRAAPAEPSNVTRLTICHWKRAIRTDRPQQVK